MRLWREPTRRIEEALNSATTRRIPARWACLWERRGRLLHRWSSLQTPLWKRCGALGEEEIFAFVSRILELYCKRRYMIKNWRSYKNRLNDRNLTSNKRLCEKTLIKCKVVNGHSIVIVYILSSVVYRKYISVELLKFTNFHLISVFSWNPRRITQNVC